MADSGEGRELLEPRLGAEGSREKLVRDLLTGKPAITPMGRSSLLDSVKDFLPKMAEAETELAKKLKEDGGRERLDVENLEGEGQVVEMDIALMREQDDKTGGSSWTSDSEADSTPSPSEENSFTSDTDVSSSSSCSSSSSEDGDNRDQKGQNMSGESSAQKKRPLIEELPSPPRAKTPRQS